MARHRLVHGVVEDFGKEMMQGLFVGAADIHAGAAAHWLETLQHLDIGGGIAVFATRSGRNLGLGAGGGRQIAEQVLGLGGFGHGQSFPNRFRPEYARSGRHASYGLPYFSFQPATI